MEHNEPIIMASVIAAGIFCQWLAWRVKIPAILPLLITGFIFGPVLHILHPQETLGALFFPIISFAVAIILFEGSLTLNWSELRTVAATVRNLLIVGTLVTWFGGALAARLILGTSWETSLLFGALIIVTGPTVIAPLLRNVRPTHQIASILKWEGIIIDPIGASIAVLVFEYIVADLTPQNTVLVFAQIVAVGAGLGLLSGFGISYGLKEFLIPDYLRDVTILAVVISVFALSNSIAPESGLLAVTVMGVYLANVHIKELREIWFFNEKLSVLLISTLFILLAANTSVEDLAVLNWRSILLLAVVILVLRPIGIQLSAIGSTLSRNERLFLSWIAPRGIVAAAISSLFAFELVKEGFTEAGVVAPLTLLVIVGTVVLQGSTAKWVAERLGVREADPQGFLILGCNQIARMLGKVLHDEGFIVRMVDTNWERVSSARMDGLQVTHGNLLSEYVESSLDLGGIGRLLAMTRNDEANALACQHLREEFGSSSVFQLMPQASFRGQSLSSSQVGRRMATEEATYTYLHGMIDRGAIIKKTSLTDTFGYAEFLERYQDKFVPLMLIQGKQVTVCTINTPISPEPGWTLISLLFDADPIENGKDTETTQAQAQAVSIAELH
ncbi:MAG: sodium:proton antiporter [Chloroflexota bacterium]